MSVPLRTEALAWTSLLGRWVEYAQASVALPDDADGKRWRAVVPVVVNLQAVTFALSDLISIASESRPLARDRASIHIEAAAFEIEHRWHGEPLPQHLLQLLGDARTALRNSIYAGTTELVWSGPEVLVIPEINEQRELDWGRGSLAMMMPGTIVMPGEPIAWWAENPGWSLEGAKEREPALPHQVYRQLDSHGQIVRDVVADVVADAVPGMPLLVPLLLEGKRIGRFSMRADEWEARQRSAMQGDRIEVIAHEAVV